LVKVVLLDGGPLGLVTNPKRSPISLACAHWLQSLITPGNRVIIPEIVDYELRRELIRANKPAGVAQLDALAQVLEYLPINTSAMRRAAELWAQARQAGRPTADDRTIDADMILAGQALVLGTHDVVTATTNVGHLNQFVPAELWQNIQP
jgi:predicted nucleic acid-binding protein